MESLLCDEVMWLMNPDAELDIRACEKQRSNAKGPIVGDDYFFHSVKEDFEETFVVLLNKESRYMPESGYSSLVKSNSMIYKARFIAVKWFIKSQSRLNFSFGTVFIAVNYLDRFISVNRCQGWKCWMFELLSVACLSVACKFNESTTIQLHEFQVDGLDHSFASSLIARMELTLLKALDWKMDSTTPFSYIDLICIDDIKATVVEDSSRRAAELLLRAVLDSEFLKFQPSVVAMSAIKCITDQDSRKCYASVVKHLESLISQDQQDDMVKCQKLLEKLLVMQEFNWENSWCGPSSPVTVLKVELFNLYDPESSFNLSRKRKREDHELGL